MKAEGGTSSINVINKHRLCGVFGYIIGSTLGNILSETHRWTSVYSHELVHCDDNV